METKLCRVCGKLGENYVHIFKTEGLKNKIETCLPIIVSQHCLLPDTICSECLENVDNFYSFIKNCLQNIIILEAQYDIMESCLKTKRKHEKSCLVDLITVTKCDKNIQTDIQTSSIKNNLSLVSYDVDSDASSECYDDTSSGRVFILSPDANWSKDVKQNSVVNCGGFSRQYFDDAENRIISEIAHRKSLKRKSDTILPQKTKIFKMDTTNRRKNKQPKKLEYRNDGLEAQTMTTTDSFNFNTLEHIYEQIGQNTFTDVNKFNEYTEEDKLSALEQVEKEISNSLKQVCLLCDVRFNSPMLLATHVYEMHGIDMAQIISTTDTTNDKKKKLPNLVKITDLKIKSDSTPEEYRTESKEIIEQPPVLQPSFVCPVCPAVLTNRSDLFTHLRIKHIRQASLMCGLCLYIANSYVDLNKHLEICKPQHTTTTKYTCKICNYGDENMKLIEHHVSVHDFVLEFCKKQSKMFDPNDYIETIINNNEQIIKTFTCSECNQNNFLTFKEFSTHRRSQHQIFHCDLCNKFYGRNSHLWKHVNRLHKGHPSITCQLCHKTSASKYHLSQHFNKIHTAKPYKIKQNNDDDFMSQKFQAFDFQSVKQSFMRQELLEKEKLLISENRINESDNSDDDRKELNILSPPKEIDTSSDLYTNIITNYTPPQNEGEFKCPKCFKGFHKKNLLKKHKKNCRPRLQKDLLTRCKTCSRIFKDRQSLTKHLINYHSEYACEICNQKVQSKCEIVSHIRFSHPNCHLVCNCGNILRNKADLSEHKKDHRNSFVCQFCADTLPTKIKLKMHILSLHRKILSLSCGICLKLFETQHILRDHVKLVHKEHLTPLMSCTVCGKNYGSKWKTYDHLNKSHGRIFKACKACLEVFDTDLELQNHYNTLHLNAQQKIVTVTQSLNTVGSNINKTYESDLEQNDDISELSNEAIGQYQQTTKSDSDEIKNQPDFTGFSEINTQQQDLKISLLERRLLGKKIPTDDTQKIKKTIDTIIPTKQIKNYDEIQLQTSSKRTVYVNSNDPSLCEICLKTWPAKKHLWQHYIRCHKTVAATVCGICLKTNDNYMTLQKHLLENHPTLLHGQGFGSNFICRICGRYHNASSKLKLHMAIHENFDWSILEQKLNDDNNKQNTNKTIEQEETNDINYESLIEQVECSSESENNNKDEECSSDESITSENSLEIQMLKNMLKEKRIHQNNTTKKEKIKIENNYDNYNINEEIEVKQEYSSTDNSEDSSNSTASFSDTETYDDNNGVVKEENCSTDNDDDDDEEEEEKQDSTSNSNTNDSVIENGLVFRRKPEELDSAIRSISYNQVNDIPSQSDDEFCDISAQSLNENEIESAVGSIL